VARWATDECIETKVKGQRSKGKRQGKGIRLDVKGTRERYKGKVQGQVKGGHVD
jgi:hypothetical protein